MTLLIIFDVLFCWSSQSSWISKMWIYSVAKKACQPSSRLSVQDPYSKYRYTNISGKMVEVISPNIYQMSVCRIYIYRKHPRKSCNANITTTITGCFFTGPPLKSMENQGWMHLHPTTRIANSSSVLCLSVTKKRWPLSGSRFYLSVTKTRIFIMIN